MRALGRSVLALLLACGARPVRGAQDPPAIPGGSRAAAEAAFAEGEALRVEPAAGSRRRALARFGEALALWRVLGDREREAAALSRIALVHYALGEPKESVPRWEQALAIQRERGDCRGEAEALNDLAQGRKALGDTRGAVPLSEEALALFRAGGDAANEAAVLHNLGMAHAALGEPRKALAYFEGALSRQRLAGDRASEARTLRALGSLKQSLGDTPGALAALEESLDLRRSVGDEAGEAVTLGALGDFFSERGEPAVAETYIEEALRIERRLGDRRAEATDLAGLGHAFHLTRDLARARPYYERALELFREVGDRRGEATELASLGAIARATGEPRKALDLLERALVIQRELGDRVGAANSLLNVATLYQALGEPERALARCQEARALQARSEDRHGETQTLDVVGNVELSRGRPGAARASYAAALAIQRATDDRLGAVESLCGLGFADLRRGRPRQALAPLDEAVALARATAERRGHAIALMGTGMARLALGDAEAARRTLAEALPLARATGYRLVEASALLELARAEQALGRLEDADAHAAAAIALHEEVRRAVTGEDLRASFLATVRDAYDVRLDILVARDERSPGQGFARRAFELSEQKRARSLLDLLRERPLDLSEGVSDELLESKRSLRSRLQAKTSARVGLLASGNEAGVAAARAEIEALTAALSDVESRIRAESPRYAALTAGALTAEKIQRDVLDPGTLLLEYALGGARSTLFVVSRDGVAAHRLPSRAVLEGSARRLYAAWSRNGPGAGGEDERLSRMLLGPARSALGRRRLLVVAEGALQYIPFAALPNGGAPLVARHEIAYAPSASSLAALRESVAGRARAPRTAAVIADPVFDRSDPRVKGRHAPAVRAGEASSDLERSAKESGVFRFDRLGATRAEADAIAGLAGSSSWKALDFEASREAVVDGRLRSFRIAHFATHALLNSRHPELSGIVLSLVDARGHPLNGFLQLQEIYDLRLGADLVVLSACQTALGRQVAGEGLVGLVRGFMHAGVPRVVASLWRVSDRSTAELMKRFYAALLREGQPAARALRSAQEALRRQPGFETPYHWAAFTLEGEWN